MTCDSGVCKQSPVDTKIRTPNNRFDISKKKTSMINVVLFMRRTRTSKKPEICCSKYPDSSSNEKNAKREPHQNISDFLPQETKLYFSPSNFKRACGIFPTKIECQEARLVPTSLQTVSESPPGDPFCGLMSKTRTLDCLENVKRADRTPR